MEKIFSKVEDLSENVKEYVNNKIELTKLTVAEKSSSVLSKLMAGIIVAIVFTFFLVFASVALSLMLGKWLGDTWLGFLVVAGIYLLIGLIVWFGREKIIRIPIMNTILHQLFKDEDNDEKN
jgi:hypothetical protein